VFQARRSWQPAASLPCRNRSPSKQNRQPEYFDENARHVAFRQRLENIKPCLMFVGIEWGWRGWLAEALCLKTEIPGDKGEGGPVSNTIPRLALGMPARTDQSLLRSGVPRRRIEDAALHRVGMGKRSARAQSHQTARDQARIPAIEVLLRQAFPRKYLTHNRGFPEATRTRRVSVQILAVCFPSS
jgi:hypothetical protein